MNILDKIVAHKKLEVEKRKSEMPMEKLEQMPHFTKPTLSLTRCLSETNRTGIIAEFKRKSPSKGIINERANVSDVTSAYATNGASGLSILTDEHFFGGSKDDLISARNNDLPILRKDFIINEYQIVETKAMGADVMLLIAAILTPAEVRHFAKKAHEVGLEVILEIHNEDELDHINEHVDIVGVNNRNLKTFEVTLDQSAYLIKKIPNEKTKISESGIRSVDDLLCLKKMGYNGFLIGEMFMEQPDPGLAFTNFITNLEAHLNE